jgi:hypothetical protein
MAREKFVATQAIRDALKGHETEILDKLGIGWCGGKPHVRGPYPSHDDKDPSWRWDERKHRAYCTCIEKSHGVFDVVMAMLGIIFVTAKIHVAELLGRSDLIKIKTGAAGQKTDPASLLSPPSGQADNSALALHRRPARLRLPGRGSDADDQGSRLEAARVLRPAKDERRQAQSRRLGTLRGV